MRSSPTRAALGAMALAAASLPVAAGTTNFEASHVHPIDLTPSGGRLLVVNTPDAMLEVFDVTPAGDLQQAASIPVGLEPVTVVARTDGEAWVVNQLSDSVSVVDLIAARVTLTLPVGDEPSDVVFAGSRAFVAVGGEDRLRVFSLADLSQPPADVPLFGRKPRALAVSGDGQTVYAVPLFSGNGTTVVNGNVIFGNDANLDAARLAALGLQDLACASGPPAYPPLPAGIQRNPLLTDPPDGVPRVGLIVRWDDAAGAWRDESGQSWNDCLPYRVADRDLFVVDAATLQVGHVDRLGTSLFEVSVNPADGRVWIPHTDARNDVRFEHPLGVRGHVVDNRMTVVDPAHGNAVTTIDLNGHIDRASDPAANLAERQASISQPGMMVWNAAGTTAWLTAIGSRKLFRLDGACSAPGCVFGSDRSSPDAVEVGHGPTGVALHEGHDRLWVLNRIDASVAVVGASTMTLLDTVPLHDPGSPALRVGRRFLYDAIVGSGHGDAACSSCHISGDRDDLAWDLGQPQGDLVPYAAPMDNVRFVVPLGGAPVECDPALCAAHAGFDPQKGPMATQTLRGMLEPLHWRGDRATMLDFNAAFVELMGTADVGPINGKPAGLTAQEMADFRAFALALTFPPNPHRLVDDTLPNQPVLVRGSPVAGNPTVGRTIFDTFPTDAGQPCVTCHTHPFGAAGGQLGGVTPAEPTSSAAAALFNGDADQTQHNDLKVAHLRNLYEKEGPTFGTTSAPALVRSGFGFTHDGAIPDLATFFSFSVFNLTPQQVADVAAFSLHFPTGTRPAVGRQVTLPPGAAPTGPPADETLLAALVALGDPALGDPHCELTVATALAGEPRRLRLAGGQWLPDRAAEAPLATAALRQQAQAPLTFLCAPLGSGARLGGDRDEDGALNRDDCAEADPGSRALPAETGALTAENVAPTALAWTDLATQAGPAVAYDVLGGSLAALRTTGTGAATGCLARVEGIAGWDDPFLPVAGAGRYYLVRGVNACGRGSAGAGRSALDTLDCEP